MAVGDVNFNTADLITFAQADETSPSTPSAHSLEQPTASSLSHILNPEPVSLPTSSAPISTTSLSDCDVAYVADDETSLPPASSAAPSTSSLSDVNAAYTGDDDLVSMASESSSHLQVGEGPMEWETAENPMSIDAASVSSGKSSRSSLKGVMDWFANKAARAQSNEPVANADAKQPAKKGVFGWAVVKSGKRKKSETSDGSDSSAGSGKRSLKEQLTKKLKTVTSKSSRPAGTSRSAQASRKLRASVADGTFVLDPKKFKKWNAKILHIDKNATGDSKLANKARHFACGEWVPGKEPYDTTNFGNHVNKCSNSKAAAGMFTVEQWSDKLKINMKSDSDPKPKVARPCPGLTDHNHPRITTYLGRTAAIGGGGRSATVISKELFRKLFKKLSYRRKDEVLTKQMHEHKWRNDHQNDRVYSTSCLKNVMLLASDQSSPTPCLNCESLLQDYYFKKALRRKPPADKNLIHMNKRWRTPDRLVNLFGRVSGLREIIELPVSECQAFKFVVSLKRLP